MRWIKQVKRWPTVVFDMLRWVVGRHPRVVIGVWLALAGLVFFLAPDLTQLAAEGQANLLPKDSESGRGAELLRRYWPDQWFDSMAVLALHRPSGLTEADRQYASTLERHLAGAGRPEVILRVLGPNSQKEVAERLVSRDGTVQLLALPFSASFVSPATLRAVEWLEHQPAAQGMKPPAGLEVRWSGDSVIGRDYMRNVQTSLDRAALATVILLLLVLMAVYRSPLLAAVPLLSIGVCLVISRGILAWMVRAGWEISPLVELFLIVLLFGSGTDFCLFISWRFGEHWNAANPAGAMRATMRYAIHPLLASAGTVIIGLSLMGTTRFKLFSSTGPSVAIGLAITLLAVLTLTPAFLVVLAKYRPRSFAGLTSPPSGFWNDVGQRVLGRPIITWLGTVILMLPAVVLGFSTWFIQDTLSEMPESTASVENLRFVTKKFGPGFVA
ncbi:MAG TPA: MMPL family transporter, partial [Isosphaeraceae bacterium]|nr:MMPL family transporter [Isosphaeraceae bacterium]